MKAQNLSYHPTYPNNRITSSTHQPTIHITHPTSIQIIKESDNHQHYYSLFLQMKTYPKHSYTSPLMSPAPVN